MDARSTILSALRSTPRQPVPHPEPRPTGVRFGRPLERFGRSVAEVGGRCLFVTGPHDFERALSEIPEYASARRVVSYVPGVTRANVDLEQVADAHELEDVDFCVLPGELGVAENGAVWLVEGSFRHRAAWYLAQHVAIALPGIALVHDMHQAYTVLGKMPRGFAQFMSGPSKTADIEQSLVMGAQGPRSCTVIVVGNPR